LRPLPLSSYFAQEPSGSVAHLDNSNPGFLLKGSLELLGRDLREGGINSNLLPFLASW
jgi:hypothetical protein